MVHMLEKMRIPQFSAAYSRWTPRPHQRPSLIWVFSTSDRPSPLKRLARKPLRSNRGSRAAAAAAATSLRPSDRSILARALDQIARFMQLHNARKSRWAIRAALVTPKRPFFCRTTVLISQARECESVTSTMRRASAPSIAEWPNRRVIGPGLPPVGSRHPP
jgi:hypothetical protein